MTLPVSGPGYGLDTPPESLHVIVTGLGVSGFPAAVALLERGGRVTVIDARVPDEGSPHAERVILLQTLGAEVMLGVGPDELPAGDVLVVSTGIPLDSPWIAAAIERGTPVWGEFELAWRLRPAQGAAPWLYVTGTNGKTTTTLMLESILKAAGLRAAAVGNIGVSLIDAVVNREPYDVLAVEIGAPHLAFVYSVSPEATVCLNVAPDHVDYFGSFDDYVAVKARAYERTQKACIYNVADPATEQMVRDAEVVEGCRAIGFTLGVPAPSSLGVVEDLLVDRAFLDNRASHAQELCALGDVKPPAPHQVENALAAAALARAHGVPAAAVGAGLRAFTPAAHRITDVGEHDGVRFVDDSKATNWHAALTSLRAYDPVVWIAGGQAKGQDFDELVAATHEHMRAVVLLGVDRQVIRESLARHAPHVPIVEVDATDTGAMDQVVVAAAELAEPGDTVLLAPGCASRDMYADYAERGDAFADAARRLGAS
ncbi:MAG: UDP-N-acetylmuramoyl-L-alanine--D-glutamate ligase [Actinobacteria bacterium]|nr:MAG: UDP-N-acetylmuramoyl-L-alanine--D-glutamate ligase [Actinomycetota bacterium]